MQGLRAGVLACGVALGLGAGALACSAIVGFPDRTLEPTSEGDADGGEGGAAPGDAGLAPIAQLDAGKGCADYPAAVACEDFEHGSLAADGWQLSNPADAGTLAVIASSDALEPNHVLALASPTTSTTIYASRSLPATDGGGALSFDFLALTESNRTPSYVLVIEQDNACALYMYISGSELGFVEFAGDNQQNDMHFATAMSFDVWHRLELDLTLPTDGGAATGNARIDGVPFSSPADVLLECGWNSDPLTVTAGYQYITEEGASYAYDNIVYEAR